MASHSGLPLSMLSARASSSNLASIPADIFSNHLDRSVFRSAAQAGNAYRALVIA